MRKFTSILLKSGTQVSVNVVNTRLLTVHPIDTEYEILDDRGKLVGLDYEGEYTIEKGSVMTVGKQKYKISEISKNSTSQTKGYALYTFRKITTTSNFIMPLLGHNRMAFRWNLEFTNAFIGDEESHDGSEISILYRFDGSREFAEFEEDLKNREDFVKMSDPDKYQTLYTFKLPEAYAKDIELIMKGKYSEISGRAKARILEFHSSGKDKPLGQILYKCPTRRKKMEEEIKHNIPDTNELFEGYTIDREIFTNTFKIDDGDSGNRDTTTAKTSDFI